MRLLILLSIVCTSLVIRSNADNEAVSELIKKYGDGKRLFVFKCENDLYVKVIGIRYPVLECSQSKADLATTFSLYEVPDTEDKVMIKNRKGYVRLYKVPPPDKEIAPIISNGKEEDGSESLAIKLTEDTEGRLTLEFNNGMVAASSTASARLVAVRNANDAAKLRLIPASVALD